MASNKPKTITVKDLKNLKNAEDAFVIKERIGAGTYGEVFTAMHKEKAKMVAIKAMNLQPDEVHEIVSEVNTLSQYSDHNNIARYFGCYIKRGPVAQIWIAMEYCAGGSIFDLIKHGGNNGKHYFKEEWIAYASREILEGLKYLHSMKVIHRDIKGQNILLTDKAEVKLVDFGVSAKLDKTVGKRCTFIGTPYWMAPEVIECEKDPSKSYTFECDIWSTGITAMEMAEGKPPLNDLHPMTALFKIPSNEPPKLKNPRDWSDRFKDFLKQCLKKNYKQRSTAEELLSTSRFVKAVNSERAQVELRQAIERVHRTKGHSRKLQRDMILRPDEGTNLEDSDEDNPETIKTIREQFKKMDNKAGGVGMAAPTPFVPQAAPPQVVSSQVSHVAPPFHQRLQNQQNQQVRRQQDGVDINIRKMYEKDNKDRKQSAPPFSGPLQPVPAAVVPKDDMLRKHSVQVPLNNSALSANVSKSTVFSNPNVAPPDANKRNSRNLDHMTPLAQASAELSRPASAAASSNLRRHPNDPTPEFPRKMPNLNQTPTKPPSSMTPTPRKVSEPFPSRPSSVVKDLRQHPISRQNAPPMSRSSTSAIATQSVTSMSDRPLPAQPPKSSHASSSSNVGSTSQVASVVQLDSSHGQNSDNIPKGVWARPSSKGGIHEHSPLPMGKAAPIKVEDIDRSPGARRKSYASNAAPLSTVSNSHDIAPSKLDSGTGASGYAQLRLDGAITDSSNIDSENSKTSTQSSFPYVDSDQESTLNKPATVRRNNYSFEDSFTSCFNNSSYSNSEEERRKFAQASASRDGGGSNMSMGSSGDQNPRTGHDMNARSSRNVPSDYPVAAARSNDSYSVSASGPSGDAVKHWQRNVPSQSPINSVSNVDYISGPSGIGRHQVESLQQQQVNVKGAVINPDYGSNLNAFSNDQYGVNPTASGAGSQHPHNGRRFPGEDLGVSNQAYDSSNNFRSSSRDSDYESLANATQAAGPIYANQLEPVVEHEQRAPTEHPDESSHLDDDSGVYSMLASEPQNNGTYERLYQHGAPSSSFPENSNGAGPHPLPRNMASRDRVNVESASGSSEVSVVTAKASLVTPLSLSPTVSQENLERLNGGSSRDLAHGNRMDSASSNSLTDDTSLQNAVASEETPLEDDLSEDSDREQADNFGTILVSSKPKPIQSDVRSSAAPVPQERNFRRGGSVKESSKKVPHATSAGDLNYSNSGKHGYPLSTAAQGNSGPVPLSVAHKKGSSASVQQVEEENRPGRKTSGGRSKSQERPSNHMGAKRRNDGSAHPPEDAEGKMGASRRAENGSVDINENNLRKSKDGRSGKSMEDVSNKRFSIASPPSGSNLEEQQAKSVPPPVADTPRRVDQIKRESVASSCSPMAGGGRSRKGSGSSNEHKNSSGQFNSFGFGAGNTPTSVNVPINITSSDQASSAGPMNPEIRKFLKKFKSEVLCACLWGVNLLIGTTKGLYFMDRSGGCEVVRLVSDRKFTQMEIIPSLSLLVTISGKNNRLREYYLKVLQTKIIKSSSETPKVHDEYGDIGNKIENCNSFKIVKYDAIRFLVVAYRTGIIVLAWAPKPCHKFMAVTEYKDLKGEPLFVNVAIREADAGGKFVLKVVYATNNGFHVVDDSGSQDIFIPTVFGSEAIKPHCIMTFPKPDEPAFLLCYNSEGAYVTDEGKFFRDAFLQWGEAPIASVAAVGSTHIMGWATNAIEFRSLVTGQLDGVFMQRNTCKMKFLCECNDKVFFASYSKSGISQIYLLTLNHQSMIGSK